VLEATGVRVAFFMLFLASFALAQDAGRDAGEIDGPLTRLDAGAPPRENNPGTEETDVNGPCLFDKDCDRGFQCINSKCTYRRFRDATFTGCAEASNAVLLVALALWRKRKTTIQFKR
jgi:hypothetical protein